MAVKKRYKMDAIKLSVLDKRLLECSVCELIPALVMNEGLLHVKQTAFSYFNQNKGEFFQVQVTVTRDESAFLEAFQTEELSEYKNASNG